MIPSNNISDSFASSPTHETTISGGCSRSLSYIEWRTAATDALDRAGLPDVAELFESCADTPRRKIPHAMDEIPAMNGSLWVCTHDHTHDAQLFAATCDLRICPDCARRQSARLVARYLPAVLQARQRPSKKHRLRHIVLTRDIELTDDLAADELRNGFTSIRALFDEMLGDGWHKTGGYIANAEFGTSGLKLHYHVVAYVPYMDQAKMSQIWENLTTSSVVFVRGIYGSDEVVVSEVQEVLKYATKFWKTNAETGEPEYIDPELMPVLYQVLHGTRRVRSVGIFYNIPEPEKEPVLCECGHEMRHVSREDWLFVRKTGWTAYELKMQVDRQQYEQLLLKLANKSVKKPPDIRGQSQQRLL